MNMEEDRGDLGAAAPAALAPEAVIKLTRNLS
jgi:hypothetical protein